MRDRDVRNAIQAALTATNAFNAVHVWGLPEDYGSGSSEQAAADRPADQPAGGSLGRRTRRRPA